MEKEDKVTVEEAFNVVVDTPVAPVMAPAEEILIEGVDKNLVKPVALSKLIPLMTLVLLFEAAGKLIPFKVLVLLVLVELVKATLKPLTVVALAPVLLLVNVNR